LIAQAARPHHEIMTTTIATRRFPTVKGQSIAADISGPEHGAPVVLMHGGGQTRHSWKKALRSFAAAGYRAYSLDARGHGDSDWDKDGDYGMSGLDEDLLAVLKQIAGAPVLIGASMGGMTSISVLGGASPPSARGLVLVDVTPRIDFSGAERIGAFMSAHMDGFDSIERASDGCRITIRIARVRKTFPDSRKICANVTAAGSGTGIRAFSISRANAAISLTSQNWSGAPRTSPFQRC
jgi:pimeloyl-ACP methyl ester carboxylesterase